MDREKAQRILSAFTGKKIVVVGDMMLDEYIWGQTSRISPEAPVLVVDVNSYSHVPGGAANVVNNICALGGTASVVGVVGCDEAGRQLTEALLVEGADTTGLVEVTNRPTTRKTRVIAHSQQVVRVDHENRTPLDEATVSALTERIFEKTRECDGVLISDYQKGVVTPRVLAACLKGAMNKPITGNLKPSTVGPHSKLTVITLNLLEASQALGLQSISSEDDIREAGIELLKLSNATHILITQGSNGLTLFSSANPTQSFHVPPRPVAVYDAAGAGDTVITTLTMALVVGASPEDAVELANYAAAETVKKLGVTTVNQNEILAGI